MSNTRTKSPHLVSAYGLTDVGRKRDHNEDSLLVVNDLGLYVVADGMGGHAAGEVASSKATEVMRDFVTRCQVDDEFTWPYGINPELNELENVLVTAIKLANREVWRIAQEKQEHHGMGTTIASIHVRGLELAVAHVGDSRVYRLSNGKLHQMTQDHSWVNEQVKRGIISPDEAKSHKWRNVITRALGNKEQLEVEVGSMHAEPGDLLLLCSDGLCAGDEVAEDAIAESMIAHGSRLPDLAKMLISLANDAGGKDNITVILLRFYATEDEAAEGSRDISQDDTNPVLGKTKKPLVLDVSKTAEIPAQTALENKLDEPIVFDEDDVETPREQDFSAANLPPESIFEEDDQPK